MFGYCSRPQNNAASTVTSYGSASAANQQYMQQYQQYQQYLAAWQGYQHQQQQQQLQQQQQYYQHYQHYQPFGQAAYQQPTVSAGDTFNMLLYLLWSDQTKLIIDKS